MEEEYESYPVYEIEEIEKSDDTGIILAMRQEYLSEVYSHLELSGYHNIERYI